MWRVLAVMLLVLLVTLVPLVRAMNPCGQPRKPVPGCLPPLARNIHHPDYAHCKNQTCYLFLQEPPFIVVPQFKTRDPLYKPFPCSEPQELHPGLEGIAFEVHALTSSARSSCIFAGQKSQCSFNQLHDFAVWYAQYGFRFAVSGAWIDTPERRCHLTPSAPLVDSSMMIVGANIASPATNALEQVTRPFRTGTWVVLLGVTLSFVLVGIAIAGIVAKKLSKAVYVLTGLKERLQDVNSKRLASSLSMLRAAVCSFGAIVYLFYGAAVVNFLFAQSNVHMTKSVAGLRVSDLSHYAVLKDSALEYVWDASVDPMRRKYDSNESTNYPWKRCSSGKECIEWVYKGTNNVQFAVTYGVLGNHFIHELADCHILTEWRSKQPLATFNIGWLFNRAIPMDEQLEINRQIVGLRIRGTIGEFVSRRKGDATCEEVAVSTIGSLVVLIPIGIFVLPLAAAGLFLVAWAEVWRWKAGRERKAAQEGPGVLVTSSV